MKATILSILLFFTVNLPDGEAGAQNIWYINRDNTSGTYNGRSWATAWTTTDSAWSLAGTGANWEIIQAGDTVYISGGADSTRYTAEGNANPAIRGDQFDPTPPDFTPQVVVTRAWHEGHNGEVWFYKPPTDTLGYAFSVSQISGIKLVDLNFYSNADFGWDGSSVHTTVVLVEDNERITFENCTFTNKGTGGALGLGGSFTIVDNCLIQNLTNISRTGQDIFTMGGGKGGNIIKNSTIIQRSVVDSTDAHPDFIQVGNFYGVETEYYETLFLNNFMWQITPTNTAENNAGIYISGGNNLHKQRFTFINNIFVQEAPETNYRGLPNAVPAIWLRGESGWGPPAEYSLRLYNNTIMYPSAPILMSRGDTLIGRNNFFSQANDIVNNPVLALHGDYVKHIDMDYNHYYVKNWTSSKKFSFGIPYTLSQWQALGYDVNSDTSHASLFAYDSVITSYYTEVGRGMGENLSYLAGQYPEIMNDIIGNPRPLTGPWDIGALQYQGASSNYINLQGKVFLQGAFNSNSMTTYLSQSSLLPASQPYNNAPWNYSGNEVLGTASGIVDWVLVELRSTTNPAQVVARRAAVLKNNGLLLNTNGVVGINFSNVDPGSYYIAIYHRNHLAIMSSTPVPLSSNSTLYDFTTAMNKAYGQNSMVELGAGKYGMYAADGNADGVVNSADRDDLWLIQNGNMGYLGGDFNMNSGVTVHDVNQFWNINNGAMTQVP